MVGLLDLKVRKETIPIGEDSVEVLGISLEGVADLLSRFPPLQQMILGEEDVTLSFDDLIKFVPEAIAVIIAYGCGYPKNREAEDKARSLTASDQADLIAAIIRLTAPEGIGPFVVKISAMLRQGRAEALPNEDPGAAPVTPSPKSSKR